MIVEYGRKTTVGGVVQRISKDWISEDRLRPYLSATYQDEFQALRLYELDRRLSAALFHEIAYIEVALRNAMVEYLSATYGVGWYADARVGFDLRVRENITEAWDSLPSRYTKNAERNQRLGGRLVAASMFRTWTNMLDKGGETGLEPPFETADHDTIWTPSALEATFRGAKPLGRRLQDPDFRTHGITREWVFKKISPIRYIRNRIAHHESIAPNGIPITGTDRRLTARECHESCLEVAEMIDRDLAAFLRSNASTSENLDELDNLKESLGQEP